MGVKGLPKLIQDIAGKSAIKKYNFSSIKGWTVSVDASLMIHQTVVAMRSGGRDLTNDKGELTSHLQGLFQKILVFLRNDVIPIFVFDGKAPNIKNKTIKQRSDRKEKAERALSGVSDTDSDEYIKYFKQTFKISRKNIEEAQILLDLMGVPYIVAPGEADVVCAWLTVRKDESGKFYAKGVCSDDSDMLLLGAKYLFKNMSRFMRETKPVEVIGLAQALKAMDLTMDQFIDLGVMMGTDYCDNIKGIGPKKAYKLIKKYGSLSKVLESMDTDDSENECDTFGSMKIAKKYFKNAVSDIDEMENFKISDNQHQLRKFQFEELMDFMCVKHGFDINRTLTALKRLEDHYQRLGVERENTKQVHKIIHPRSENYVLKNWYDDVNFIPSDDETSKKVIVSK